MSDGEPDAAHQLILAQNIIARARQIAALSVDDLVRLTLTELDYQLEDAATAVHRARGLYDDQNGYTGQLPAVVSDPAETARKIIATWTRGLITLAEMVTELQKVSDVRDRELLQAGAEIAAQRNDSNGR